MPLWFPPRSFQGGRAIDTYSLNSLPTDDELGRDPASVRFRSVAEIMLRGIRRCVAADRESGDESSQISAQEKPVLDNLGDSLPEPLDFVSDKPLSVSDVSETRGFGSDRTILHGGKSWAMKRNTDRSWHFGELQKLGQSKGSYNHCPARTGLTCRSAELASVLTYSQQPRDGYLAGIVPIRGVLRAIMTCRQGSASQRLRSAKSVL